jgi:hypothetical protein
MKRTFIAIAILAAFVPGYAAHAQAAPTATRGLDLSAFGGVAGVDTGLSGGRNLSFVVGADLGFVPIHGVRPKLEVRGLYPMDGGNIASQRSVLFGPRFDFLLNRRLHPYGDFVFGRGQVNYESGGYPFGGSVYLETTTNVYSPGGGVDYDLSPHLSIKADAQFQRWGYMPTPSGSVWSKVGTIGVVYHFTFGPRRTP